MPETTNFNKTHPELQEGEEFFMNYRRHAETDFMSHVRSRYPQYEWRFGNIAYTPKGEIVEDNKPVFRKKK